jgi:hypothetical protein
VRLTSEFAAIEIERDDSGNGPRLLIRDAGSGKSIYLDPLELWGLAWARHEDLIALLDPSRRDRHSRNGA